MRGLANSVRREGSMSNRLEGKVAFITGAGSGIARAASHIFTREGAKVIIAELDEARGIKVLDSVRESGGDAIFVRTDVTEPDSIEAAIAHGVEHYGRLDVLFNCAGGSVADDKAVTDVDLDIWDHTINLDMKGPFLCCRYAIPHLVSAGGGSIVNVTSVVALKGNFPGHVYTAAKGGIISFTRALAGRYWRNNIRANAIAPGLILSERILERSGLDPDGDAANLIEDAKAANEKLFDPRHPFSAGIPEDIANVALFLASDESRMVNGAVIPAEGGLSAY
jgi:NAD(P)-dependent dehydrogenase (short-subunit alcohol dehydrogenase family)